METHQTTDLRIAGSIPAMLVFLDDKKHIKDKSIQQKGQKEKEKNTSLSYISYILSKKKKQKGRLPDVPICVNIMVLNRL